MSQPNSLDSYHRKINESPEGIDLRGFRLLWLLVMSFRHDDKSVIAGQGKLCDALFEFQRFH